MPLSPIRSKLLLAASAAPFLLLSAPAAQAQEAVPADTAPDAGAGAAPGDQDDGTQATPDGYTGDEIVVRATRLKGEIDTDIPMIKEIDAQDVAGYGASSISELISLLGPETGSGRGRGDGEPVILLNGRRISSFRELADLPPEAIARVQIYPEELALKFGYRPDQRVINIVLVEQFASVTAEYEYGQPTQGGRSKQEVEGGLTKLGDTSRINLDVQYSHESPLLESERGIVQPDLAPGTVLPVGITDLGRFRTLQSRTDDWQLNGTYSRNLGEKTSLSITGSYGLQDSYSLNGLPSIDFFVPGTSPFSPTGTDTTFTRYYGGPQPLASRATTQTSLLSAGLSSSFGDWRWSLLGNYAGVDSQVQIDRSLDSAALQALVASGAVDPFAAATGQNLLFVQPDLIDSQVSTADVVAETSGTLFNLPAGEVQLSLNGGYNQQDLTSSTVRLGQAVGTKLGRGTSTAAGAITVPLTSRRNGVLDAIGDLGINGNFGYKYLSDFGSLLSYGGGLNWEPTETLRILFSYIGEESAPDISALGSPITVTPNVPFFDFTTGQTVLITQTSGGNPGLLAESRGDIKFNIGWQPKFLDNLRIEAEYNQNRSRNVVSALPPLTPAIERAFADRVTRGPDGRLLALDVRSVTFAENNSARIRWGINYNGEFGGKDPEETGDDAGEGSSGDQDARPERPARPEPAPPTTEAMAPPAGDSPPPAPPADGSTPAADGATPAQGAPAGERSAERPRPEGQRGSRAGRGGGRRGGPFGGGDGKGRWRVSLYHTYALQDEVLIRDGVPKLDLLNGDATGSRGGSPRHQVELESGMFYKGMGLRLAGNYRSATRITGDPLTGSSDLFFSDLATFDLRLFANLEQVLKKDKGVFKGTRLSLRVNNLFGAIQTVRDNAGTTPLRYQPGFVDPTGRYVEISLRKQF